MVLEQITTCSVVQQLSLERLSDSILMPIPVKHPHLLWQEYELNLGEQVLQITDAVGTLQHLPDLVVDPFDGTVVDPVVSVVED